MAGRSAGTVTVNFAAGTSGFVADVEKAKAKVIEFNRATTAGVSQQKAATIALREMEGGFANNSRAIATFMSQTLKMGPILQAAFPVLGALAFGSVAIEITKKVADFVRSVQDAPAKISAAFREMVGPMALSNQELQVGNDKLADQIAKLQGLPQNNLRLALDEARLASDKLADSLSKSIGAIDKLIKEQAGSGWHQFWASMLGQAQFADLANEFGGKTGQGGFAGVVAGTKDAADQMIAYQHEISKVQSLLEKAQSEQQRYLEQQRLGTNVSLGRSAGQPLPSNQSARIEVLGGTLASLRMQQQAIAETMDKAALEAALPGAQAQSEARKASDEAIKAGAAYLKAAQTSELAGTAKIIAAYKEKVKEIGNNKKALDELNAGLVISHLHEVFSGRGQGSQRA